MAWDGMDFCNAPTHLRNISRGRWGLRQLDGFLVVAVIVALFVPTECPVGGGMWGIFGKPLKRAIWNTWVCMLY